MNVRKLRNLAFYLHRYLGLIVGLILIIVGLSGSLLVFQREIDHFLIGQQFGRLTPQQQQVPVETILQNVRETYKDQPDLKIDSIDFNPAPDLPSTVWFESEDDKWKQVLVNPYTNEILGTRQWDNSLFGITYRLHYELLAGEPGIVIVGIAALFLFILSVTGLILWPGWRRLIAGFKIKWNAHPKRVNFDLHKVAGIISAVFLVIIAFTGFCWNFYEQTEPIIYAATFTPKPVEPVSKVIPAQEPMNPTEILQRADAALPGATTTYLNIPTEPDGVYRVNKKFPQEREAWGRSQVYLDQYTGEVLRIKDVRSLSRGEAVLDAFSPLHYGTFWGLPTRILYVFIGLSPTILFITGFVMYRYHRRGTTVTEEPRQPIAH
ncbi:PepSY domain-containing protein [Pleurocapsales cyanobacterium LEGE 06147]|nr:PepSY domain-containing protein [Pleurocapsales cyanobacterium LEGE 06147]